MENGKSIDMDAAMVAYDKMFNAAFTGIVDELVKDDENNEELNAAATWLRQALNYNSFDGKKSRGKMVIGTLCFLRNGNPTEEEVKKAIYLGWCVEILQAVFLVADDIMDKSELRRGKPCWYKNTGLIAINDTYLMEQCIYKLIDTHFENEAYLVDLYKAFHNITYLTAMGQELDMIVSDNPNEEFTLDNFNIDRYKSIVKYKTAYYSFYLPVCLGMFVAHVKDSKLFKEAENILMKLGEFFQIQDDYLDCYGDPSVTGKVGRDIEDGKCSWLVVHALQKISKEDKLILEVNYGKEDAVAVSVVKDLYNKLQLPVLYHAYEEKSFQDICELIKSQREGFPKQLFLFLALKIYKRQR